MNINTYMIIRAINLVQKKHIYQIKTNIYVKRIVQKIIHMKMKIVNAFKNVMLLIYLIIYVKLKTINQL